MKALLRKDAWLHWKHFLLAIAAYVVLVLLMKLWLQRTMRPPRLQTQLLQFHLMLLFTACIQFSEWLVIQERARRTILWLRTLPFSDWHIVGSKFVAYFLMHWGMLFVGTAIIAPGWFTSFSADIIRYAALVQVFGGTMLGSRLLLNGRIALLVPLTVVLAGASLYGLTGLDVIPPFLVTVFTSLPGVLAASQVLYIATYCITAVLMSRRETPAWAS